jgi:predicted nucleic acid-binding protein
MTKKEFLNAISNGKVDIVQAFLNALSRSNVDYCVVGGLAVNAYAEPVVSLDLDIVVAADNIETLIKAIKAQFKIQRFTHSVNLSTNKSDLRIQLQMDSRYQDFISRAASHTVLGYKMKVACVEDVFQGKIWAYLDDQRRKSKRQKDLADIVRLIEVYPSLAELLPATIRERIE